MVHDAIRRKEVGVSSTTFAELVAMVSWSAEEVKAAVEMETQGDVGYGSR
ncbi:MAG: hypothetical protein ABR555_00390 [Pyrinomonadaceae bacterium]